MSVIFQVNLLNCFVQILYIRKSTTMQSRFGFLSFFCLRSLDRKSLVSYAESTSSSTTPTSSGATTGCRRSSVTVGLVGSASARTASIEIAEEAIDYFKADLEVSQMLMLFYIYIF